MIGACGKAVESETCSRPGERTQKEIFERLLAYTLSPEYDEMRTLIGRLATAADQRASCSRSDRAAA